MALSAKFERHYGVYRTEGQRRYAKLSGRANARLIFFAAESDTELSWWLLATTGTGAVHVKERLRDAHQRNERMRLGDRYELLPLTKPRHLGGGTTWTWRMTRGEFDAQRAAVITACRRTDAREAQRLVATLARSPGFSGVRRQVGSLMALMRREWRRRHGTLEQLPLLGKLHYVERLASSGIRLSELRRLNGVGERS